jgi:hypothetical protein
MHEYWLQKYIQEYSPQMGFTQLHGPYKYGADFKGVYGGKPVKIEAEWEYSDYLSHTHTLKFAEVLVVATLEPIPPALIVKLPSIIINLNRQKVVEWAQPRIEKKTREDYYSYPWRRFSRSLLYLYGYYQKQNQRKNDFMGASLLLPGYQTQTPPGFHFAEGGKEESFAGLPEDKAAWDYWLDIAHTVANHFHLKPALLRLTWVDRTALYLGNTGRITAGESKRFEEVAVFIDSLLLGKEPQETL